MNLSRVSKAVSAGIAAAIAAGAAPSTGGHVYWWQALTFVLGGVIVGVTTYFAPQNTPAPAK